MDRFTDAHTAFSTARHARPPPAAIPASHAGLTDRDLDLDLDLERASDESDVFPFPSFQRPADRTPLPSPSRPSATARKHQVNVIGELRSTAKSPAITTSPSPSPSASFPLPQHPRLSADRIDQTEQLQLQQSHSHVAALSTSSRCHPPRSDLYPDRQQLHGRSQKVSTNQKCTNANNVSSAATPSISPSTTEKSTAKSVGSSTHLRPASPKRKLFDSWNSTGTGHQRAENRLASSTAWRDSRNAKLAAQFRGGVSERGVERVADTVGAGSVAFGRDGRKVNGGLERGASGLRMGGQKSLVEIWGKGKGIGIEKEMGEKKENDVVTVTECIVNDDDIEPGEQDSHNVVYHHHQSNQDNHISTVTTPSSSKRHTPTSSSNTPPPKQIFSDLCFYINGSTAPLVSDHKLKHLLAERGARLSIALGRKTVTHVVLGNPNNRCGAGAGGGLAGGKIQKEISRIRAKGVKFVGVEW